MAEDGGTAADGGGQGEATTEDDAAGAETPHFVEVWNDYDPSQRFAVIFPIGPDFGAKTSSVAYYIIEPGRHSGSHSDNAEEVVFVTEGEGEVFAHGKIERLEAGKFLVFEPGVEHDIYAHGTTALRLLSFYPVPEMVSTFQQVVFPMGATTLSSTPPKPPVEIGGVDDAVPEDFPFDLGGLEGASELAAAGLGESLIGGSEAQSEDESGAPGEESAG